MKTRSPIAVVLGHVDVGKTSLLDKIRGTGVQQREAGGITQHIGASFFPMSTIKEISGDLIKKQKVKLSLNGILIIDTPGHAVFWNLRSRGGAVADIAILVVDINKGFQPQTWECIKILRAKKTPFLIAANMLDRVNGWKSKNTLSFLESFNTQEDFVKTFVDEGIYQIMGDLSKESIQSERFDRITDFKTNVAIVPTSAKTGEGISELLFVLSGLTQQHLLERLETTSGPAKGSVLEVKEEVGIGTTIDVIIYDGILKKSQQVIIGGLKEPFQTKIRAILVPKPLDEIRDPKQKFNQVEEVVAAAGIKIVAPDLDKAIAGAPIYAVGEDEDVEKIISEVRSEINKLKLSTDKEGVVLKADTLGSLEAVSTFMRDEGVKIRLSDIGDISYNDVMEASTYIDKNKFYAVILAFNVKLLPDAKKKALELGIKIFESRICYQIVEDYLFWVKEEKEADRTKRLGSIVKPGVFQILPHHTFRSCKPAVVGVKVLSGEIKSKARVIRSDGKKVGTILQIQDKNENLQIAKEGAEVAVSIRGPVVGRNIKEKDLLYIDVPEEHVRTMKKKMLEDLTESEMKALNELIKIKRKNEEFWGY
ncbi:MAG: translation initiation factor IF-2 [Candidatus Ranarchaeia archaeon]